MFLGTSWNNEKGCPKTSENFERILGGKNELPVEHCDFQLILWTCPGPKKRVKFQGRPTALRKKVSLFPSLLGTTWSILGAIWSPIWIPKGPRNRDFRMGINIKCEKVTDKGCSETRPGKTKISDEILIPKWKATKGKNEGFRCDTCRQFKRFRRIRKFDRKGGGGGGARIPKVIIQTPFKIDASGTLGPDFGDFYGFGRGSWIFNVFSFGKKGDHEILKHIFLKLRGRGQKVLLFTGSWPEFFFWGRGGGGDKPP